MIDYQDLEDRIASLERTVRNIGIGQELTVGRLHVLGDIHVVGSAEIEGDLTVDTDTFHVDSANDRVGIGTAAPTYSLDIQDGDRIRLMAAAGSEATLEVRGAAGYDADIELKEGEDWNYIVRYDASTNAFKVITSDSDGGDTAADVIRIPDGQLTVDGNDSFDDDAF